MNERERFRQQMHLLFAARHRMLAAKQELAAAAVKTAASMRGFAEAFQAGFDRDVATHPDLAELNVRMDALYDQPR